MDYQQPDRYGVIQPNQKCLLYQANAQVSVCNQMSRPLHRSYLLLYEFAGNQSPQWQNDQYIIVGEHLEL